MLQGKLIESKIILSFITLYVKLPFFWYLVVPHIKLVSSTTLFTILKPLAKNEYYTQRGSLSEAQYMTQIWFAHSSKTMKIKYISGVWCSGLFCEFIFDFLSPQLLGPPFSFSPLFLRSCLFIWFMKVYWSVMEEVP